MASSGRPWGKCCRTERAGSYHIFHGELTCKLAGCDGFLHQFSEDSKDFGRDKIPFNVDIRVMPALEALGKLLHFQPLPQLLRLADRREELCSVGCVITPLSDLLFFVASQAKQRDSDEELAGC